MEELLAKLIYDNVSHGIDINDVFIRSIIEIVIDVWKIQEYKGDYKINKNLKQEMLANYSKIQNSISINEQLLINPNNSFFYGINVNDLYNKYHCVLQILLHELIHAKQFEIGKLDINNIENLIIYSENKHRLEFTQCDSLSDLMKYLLISRFAKKYYLYSPMERLAEIDSSKIVKTVSEILNISDITDAMDLNINYNLVRGYEFKNDNLVPPTPYYLSKINSDKYISEITTLGLSEKNYNKLRFGLECEEDDFLSIGEKLEESYQKVKEYIK